MSIPGPAEGFDALADVSRIGLEAAAAAVDRLLQAGRGGTRMGAAPSAASPGEFRQQMRRLRAETDRLADLSGEMVHALLDGLLDVVESADGFARPEGHDVLDIGPVTAGSRASARAWFHVLDGPAAGSTRLWATTLWAADGSALAAPCVDIDPPVLDTADLRTSREVSVAIAVPPATRPGRYHGHLLAEGLDEVSLVLRVEVVSAPVAHQ